MLGQFGAWRGFRKVTCNGQESLGGPRWLVGLISIALSNGIACTQTMNEPWVQVETQHIRLRSNRGEAAARKMASRLQATRDVLHASVLRCGFRDDEQRIEVTNLSPRRFGKIADFTWAGYFQSAPPEAMGSHAAQIVLRDELGHQARQVFQHEIAHRLVANCFPAAPIWLNEGMATFLETLQLQDGTLSIGFPRYVVSEYAKDSSATLFHGQVIERVLLEYLPSVSELLRMSAHEFYMPAHADERELSEKRQGNYAAAWSLVHFLEISDTDLHGPFQRYLRELISGNNSEAGWQENLAAHDVDVKLREYLQHSATSYLTRKYRPSKQPPTLSARALTPAESELHLAWLWGFKDAEHRRQAAYHAQRALQHSRMNAEAHLVIALSALYSSDPNRAFDHLDAALRDTPRDPALLALLVASCAGNDSAALLRQNERTRDRIASHGSYPAALRCARPSLRFHGEPSASARR